MVRLLVALLVTTIAGTASAQVESIRQRFILVEPLIAPLAAVDLFALVDLSSITGSGSESAVVTAASFRLLSRADETSPFVITAAADLLLPPNPYVDSPMAMRADFLDGAFLDDLRVLNDPGNSGFNLIMAENAAGFAGLLTVDGFDLIYGPTILDLQRYRLTESSITPAPASVAIFVLGGALGARRRRSS
ncbi:MAG: hypothetical protein AAGG07_05040 [Planctomycetota bacterium]